MKNLKRILSLMVALVLCLGMASVASAASYDAYPDADEVSYEEAMDVLVALGIIEGTDSGSLDPTGTLTREQAAKIIAYLCLGETSAEALTAYTAPFTDVAADRWSAGFIAYCSSAGIINGRGDGTFDPEAEVTGYEFAKIVLAALGYGANGEFTGTNWALNTASYGTQVGIFSDSTDTTLNDAITREEAALYAFNALTGAMTVSYSSTLDAYYSGTTPFADIAEEDEYLYTLGYQVYDLEQGDSGIDDFGRVGYAWEVDGTEITDTYTDDPAATFTGEVTSAEIYSEVGSSYAGDATLYVDGEQLEDFPITRNNTVDSVGYLSSETYVYTDSDAYEVTIVVINTYLGEITAVDDGEVTVTVYDSGLSETDANMRQHGVNVSGSYDYETTAFNEDEFVLVTVAGGEIQSMQAAGAVNGVMDALSDDYLVIDGTSYDKSDTYGEHDESENAEDYDSEYTFYLDQNGYVLGSEIYEEADADYSSYIYVDGSEVSRNALTGVSTQISVQYLDGTTEILDLYVTESSGTYYYTLNGVKTEIDELDGAELTALADGGFFRYSMNDSGYVSLRSLSSSSQDAAGWVENDIDVESDTRALYIDGYDGTTDDYTTAGFGDTPTSSVYLNSSTNLYVIDDDEDVTLVSGYSDIKGYSDDGVAILMFYNGNVVEDIYVFGGSYSSKGNYALYVGRYTTSDETYYQFYQDGVTLEYTSDGTLSLTTKSVYNLEVSGDTIEDYELEMSYGEAEEVTRSRTDYFTTDSGTYYYDDDVVAYDYTADNAPATLTGGDYVVYAIDDGMVAAVYIVPDPADEGDGETGSSGITLSDVRFGDDGYLNFVPNKADETLYIVVEKFMDSGYTTLVELTETTKSAGDNQWTSRQFTEGDYRVTFYADEDHEELIGTYYLESTYTSGT